MRTRSGRDIKHAKPPPSPKPKAPAVVNKSKSKVDPQITKLKREYEKQLGRKDKKISTLTKQLSDARELAVGPLHETIEVLLACSICYEPFNQPHMLPSCGHTFCFNCIVGWRKMCDKLSGKHGSSTDRAYPCPVGCPMCRNKEKLKPIKNSLIESLALAFTEIN